MNYRAEVIIYGGTSAAVIAAVQIAKMGKIVKIVCPDKHLGGLTSSGLGWTDTGNKEVIGGLAREFYRRVYTYYQKPSSWKWQQKEEYGAQGQGNPAIDAEANTMWIFEPHVAEKIFNDFIKEYKVSVHKDEWLDRNNGVEKKNGRILSMKMLSGNVFKGRVFIDATYEGDLMAASGVSYHVGRESNSTYQEQWNGVQKNIFHHDHYFKEKISPYVAPDDPKSGLLPRISPYSPQVQGQGDKKIQAYTFRMCLTKHPINKVPFTKPEGYDPWQYELLIRLFSTGWNEVFHKFDPIPNLKTDSNNHGPFSFDNIGMNYDYPEGSYKKREQIIKEHEQYQKGLLYFIATDPRVPAAIRNEMKQWGYAKDEFSDNSNWPHQIYVREARRMIGEFVMTENEILGKKSVPNAIAMGSYTLDSHNTQRYVEKEGYVQNEGDVGIHPEKPYGIALGAILPKKNQCKNLLTPVAVSSSHIAYGSIRMEPVFMALGQAAATVACLGLSKDAIHEVSYERIKNVLLKDGQVIHHS